MYMIGSERGVSGASFGGRVAFSAYFVYPPPSPLSEGVFGRPDGSIFLVTRDADVEFLTR